MQQNMCLSDAVINCSALGVKVRELLGVIATCCLDISRAMPDPINVHSRNFGTQFLEFSLTICPFDRSYIAAHILE